MPSQPDLLWEEFHDNLCDDLPYQLCLSQGGNADIPLEEIYNYGLFLIDKDLSHNGASFSSFPSMPHVCWDWQKPP